MKLSKSQQLSRLTEIHDWNPNLQPVEWDWPLTNVQVTIPEENEGSRVIQPPSSSSPSPPSTSSLDFLAYVLRATDQLTFHSTSRLRIFGKKPAPVEIRDANSGRIICTVVSVSTGQSMRVGQNRVPLFNHLFVDTAGRVILAGEMAPMAYQPTFFLSNFEGPLGLIVASHVFSCSLKYKVKINDEGPSALKAVGVSKNCCCCYKTSIINFQTRDPQTGQTNVIADLEETFDNKEQLVQLNLPRDLNIITKTWILFIAWHVHMWNLADTPHGLIGGRGWENWLIFWSIVVSLLVSGLVSGVVLGVKSLSK